MSAQGPVLVVDDESEMSLALQETLRQDGYKVDLASNGKEALRRFEDVGPYRWVITDLKMPQMDGWALLTTLRRISPETRVILMTAFGSVPQAVDAMRQGAVDFLMKPFSPEALRRLLCPDPLPLSPDKEPMGEKGEGLEIWKKLRRPILTRDPRFLRLLKMVESVSRSQATVLIEGESGTGKELLARFIHEASPRAHRPFVAVNCAAIPDGLLEPELFGYEKGAFSGAVARKIGKFELADSGTILLDEIGEMELSLQSKLLRVLQEREVDRVGGTSPVPVDLRVIATTNRNMKELVASGKFREDLYYRLRVFPVQLPPLRERKGDIPLLARHILGRLREDGIPVGSLTQEAMNAISSGDFPGNIRELENLLTQLALLSGGEDIRQEHLSMGEGLSLPLQDLSVTESHSNLSAQSPEPFPCRPGQSVREVERDLILMTLEACGGNRTQAARMLEISVRTLRNKLHEYGVFVSGDHEGN
ncbi:MAG: sigma-54-dependent transcriptional regulator [Leptospirillum sp.]